MPEGHTVHRLARQHQRRYAGSPSGCPARRAGSRPPPPYWTDLRGPTVCELLNSPQQWAALWADLVDLMRDGVRRGRIDTVRPEHDPTRTGRAPRQDRHGGEVYVYRRAGLPCLVCGTAVATAKHANRNLYWCPTCQHP